jgi:hypothetical protein
MSNGVSRNSGDLLAGFCGIAQLQPAYGCAEMKSIGLVQLSYSHTI